MKLILPIAPLLLGLLVGTGMAQQGAQHGDVPGARQAFSSHDTIVRRRVSDRSAALGSQREVVTIFDVVAFRARAPGDAAALSAGAVISDEVSAAPLVLPEDFIEAFSAGPGALSVDAIDTSTAYFRESAIGFGFLLWIRNASI